MSITKHFRTILLLITGISIFQVYAQPADTVLQNMTIGTKAIIKASNSITAGPNFTIAGTGDVTFVAGGSIYFRPEIVIIQGGKLRVGDSTLVVGDVRILEAPIPTKFSLQQNYPNPFNPVTTIQFSIPKQSLVVLAIFNSLGSEVAVLVNQQLPPGNYRTQWTPHDFPSGVYFYQLRASAFIDTKKLLLLR